MEENRLMDTKAPMRPELVQEFVGCAHGDMARVRELLDKEPQLINAAWDWGGGDWETALGAAGHMGRADIASYLLGRGARLDVFVAAMLGKLDIVAAILQAFPETQDFSGPHGIPLIAHAIAGGESAAAVAEFLRGRATG
jgi:hypothetical protein